MRYLKQQLLLFFVLMVLLTSSAIAQFDEPQIIKIEGANAAEFEERFSSIKWTGQGFNYNSLDRMPAIEIRARLQSAYGDPTKTIETVMGDGEFRAGKAIQFEYWFVVNGSIPMMVLDLDGPFADGLVYVGASRYIDLMPEVKRTLTRTVTEAEPKEYTDYFFSPEREQWYKVSYKDGDYTKEEIDKPSTIRM
jgi:hypothetical protein